MNNKKLSLQEAINKVVEVIHKHEKDFIMLKDKYLKREERRDEVKNFLTNLEYAMSGNLYHHQISPRFHGTNFKGRITSGLVIWHPHKTIFIED